MIIPIYLITRDLVETLERKFGYNLTQEVKRDFEMLEEGFLNRFCSLLPSDLQKTYLTTASVSKSLEDYFEPRQIPVISLDRVYLRNADAYLEVTRLTDIVSGEVILSERSGKKRLFEQLENLGKKYAGKKISLTDVGAFEGKTILDVCEMLNNCGIGIEEICLGISGLDAKEKLSEKYKLKVFNLFKFYEWVELRDLLGIDGRNVGFENGKRLIMPYWENIVKWASIPENKKEAAENLCKEFNCQIVGRLWQEGYNLDPIGIPIKYLGNKK